MKTTITIFAVLMLSPDWVFSEACKESSRIVSKGPTIKETITCVRVSNDVYVKMIARTSNGKQIGLEEEFWPNGQRKRLFNFKNNVQEDSAFGWDSLGNMKHRSYYRHGKMIGKRETWYDGGKPEAVRTFSSKGIEEGPTKKWWPNGNPQLEGVKKNKTLVSATEFYPTGKPRIQYDTKYEPKVKSAFKIKYISGEAWAPNGKSCGKIERGNGEWLIFPSGEDSTNHTVFREVYKDSLAVKIDQVDSVTVSSWYKP